MKHLEKITRLISSSQYATAIQVAILIKQALRAHRVAIIKTTSNQRRFPEVIWEEGLTSRADPRTYKIQGEEVDENILCDISRRLYTTTDDTAIQQVRYLTAEAILNQELSNRRSTQAIHWQVSQPKGALSFIWLRRNRMIFSAKDKILFQQLRPIASNLLAQRENTPALAHDEHLQHKRRGAIRGALSPMERIVLEHLRGGMTEKETAIALHRSPHTIHVHIKSLYRKFLVHSRPDLLEETKT